MVRSKKTDVPYDRDEQVVAYFDESDEEPPSRVTKKRKRTNLLSHSEDNSATPSRVNTPRPEDNTNRPLAHAESARATANMALPQHDEQQAPVAALTDNDDAHSVDIPRKRVRIHKVDNPEVKLIHICSRPRATTSASLLSAPRVFLKVF